jgi:hypothetical protein
MPWLVDVSNVIGSRPDGWWRDRDGATRRLLAQLAGLGEPVTAVLDAGDPALAGADADGDGDGDLTVVIAPRRGRDAADDEIVRRLEADPEPAAWSVVTSDRALAERVRALGASVMGAGAFRRRLDAR